MFCVLKEFVNHGCRQGNAAEALAQWQHPVASSEAWDVHHRAMFPALHRHICVSIKMASILPAFFVVVDLIVGHSHR
jgi:hypothetical protein